ncbi:MAG: peptidylprolyl isomerase [Bacteroidales bacterium]|nr:peptidylprolyl isomerase [Bacteroidales bacterium]MDE7104091.1 peptidylprolyl isomerase [Bacteroidales bacterium]
MKSVKRPMARLMAGILFLTTVITMAQAQTKVRIETPYGDMVVKLYDETPKHRDNFIKLVKEGFYDNLLFHRVIENFMIQGGDPDSKGAPAGKMLGVGDVGYTVPAEFVKGLYHKKGALSAARQSDAVNPAKASSGCQFYIVQGQVYPQEIFAMFESRGLKLNDEQKQLYSTVGGTPHLDGDYTVFGEVIEGLDIIDKIAAVQTDRADRPVEDVWMKMRIEK